MRLIATAVIVAILMILTSAPVSGFGADEVDATSGDVPGVEIVDNGNGSYTLKSDYLEQAFGIKGPAPSDVDDPVGSTPVGISPLELVYWMGWSSSSYDVREISDAAVKRHDVVNHSTDSNHAVAFAVALTLNNGGAHVVADSGSPWN